MDGSELELQFPASVKKAMDRRGITEDEVREAIAAPFDKLNTGPNNVVCQAALSRGWTLQVQYSIVERQVYVVLHASWAEGYVRY